MKDPLAVEFGRRGGKSRLTTMTREERSRVARIAAQARWHKKNGGGDNDGGGGPRLFDSIETVDSKATFVLSNRAGIMSTSDDPAEERKPNQSVSNPEQSELFRHAA